MATGWSYVDPAITLVIALLVLSGAFRILRESTHILMESVPLGVDYRDIFSDIAAAPGIVDVHDLHVWTISSGVHLMTCHAVVGNHGCHHEVLARLSAVVRERFGIEHSTIQLECVDLWHIEQTGLCDRRPPT